MRLIPADMKFAVLSFLMSIFSLASAQAYESCVMNLHSNSLGGVDIRVSFFAEVHNGQYYPFQISAEVQGREPTIHTYDRVSLYLNWNPGYRAARAEEVRLYQTSGRPAYFHADLGAKNESIGIHQSPRVQHLSVTVGGESLIDPITGRNYFEISFQNAMLARGRDCIRN